MRSVLISLCLLALLLPPLSAVAADSGAAADGDNEGSGQESLPPAGTPSPPSSQPSSQPPGLIPPGVTISPGPDDMIQEYRYNGRLYMIKVTPHKGYSYYLVDTNGDGNLDSHRTGLESNVLIPQWTILRWK